MSRFSELISGTDKKKAHLAMVMYVGLADGMLDPRESHWAMLVCTRLGLAAEDWDDVRQNLDAPHDVCQGLYDLSKSERAVVLADCIHMGQVDGHLDESELEMLNRWAAALELRPEEGNAIYYMMQAGLSPDSIASAFS